MKQPHLLFHNLTGKRVFLRADLNVPVHNGTILNDFRLTALQPTLDYLRAHATKIVMATHRGRPHGVDLSLSTEILVPWFQERGYPLRWAKTIHEAEDLAKVQAPGSIILIENLRFHPEEYRFDTSFAKKLRGLGDFYVNDAFSVLHRIDASTTSLPALYQTHEKSIGFRVHKELEALSLFREPKRPFVLVLGGGKIKDKLPYCEPLLDRVDTLIILPALSSTFLKALGHEVGKSLIEESMLDLCNIILRKAAQKGVSIVLPADYMVALDSVEGPLTTVESIPPNGIALSVGPKSLELYKQVLSKAQTIFFNGAMGLKERKESLTPLYELLTLMANSNAFTGIGGGDSVAAAYSLHNENKLSFCSTGGGASLHYLAYGTLPALSYSEIL